MSLMGPEDVTRYVWRQEMGKHSPGPWKWGDDMKSADQSYRLLDADDSPVFWCLDKGNGPGGARSIGATRFADLDLIEAAPEMFDLLDLWYNQYAECSRPVQDEIQRRTMELLDRLKGSP